MEDPILLTLFFFKFRPEIVYSEKHKNHKFLIEDKILPHVMKKKRPENGYFDFREVNPPICPKY